MSDISSSKARSTASNKVSNEQLLELKNLVAKHTPTEGGIETAVKDLLLYRADSIQSNSCQIYDAGIIVMASGQKRCHLDNKNYDYGPGRYLGAFLPTPVDVEEVYATPEEPILLLGIKMDLNKIAEMLIKIDKLDKPEQLQKTQPDSAGLFTESVDDLLDPIIRLLKTLDSPSEVAMLSENIIDEIYYRVLTGKHVSAIRGLLEHRGQIQQISRAVNFINNNLAETISVEDLAARANMSVSHFHKNFKDVMHMSPLQYAKSMKLFKAQSLIGEGKKASQAGYMVGYNSPAQFSREYKRQFGISPSETVTMEF